MKLFSLFVAKTAFVIAGLLLAGCAQMIRNDANDQLRAGQYEAAIKGLEAGVFKYPENALLRGGLIAAREEAVTRLLSEAVQQRGQGRFDDAGKTLQRAIALVPDNDRVLEVQGELAAERRARKNLDAAQALVASGKSAQALRSVEAALRDTPRQPALLALQRRLEADLRFDAEAFGNGRSLAEGRPISLDFRNAPLSTVLDAITRGSGVNFVLDRDVRQDSRVTIFLRSAKTEDALELVTSANQLARRIIDPQTVLIYPNTPEKQREHQEQVIRVFHLANTDAKSTAAMLRTTLRLKDAFVDERANLVVLRENPDIIALAERLVALQDVGEPEVMLEVEIMEVRTSRLTELGINFPSTLSLTPLSLPGATGLTVDALRDLSGSRIGVGVSNLVLNLRREVGDVNILANPRIRTKSKEKSRIMIGDKVPVVTSTTTSTGFVSESVSYLDVGLKLEAEPVVSADDDVSIKLGLEVSSIANTLRTAGGSTVYQIGTRNANTVLRLHDGETQVLAGLISNEDRSSSNRVPGLGDLPIAGRLFSSQKDDRQRTELILAITPRIVHAAARPDLSQAEMWVGSELSTRLRPNPNRGAAAAATISATKSGLSPVPTSNLVPLMPVAQTPNVPVAAVAPGPVALTWKSPTAVAIGETFLVELNVASFAPLRSLPVEISFPADMVEVVSVVEGQFFKQSNAAASFSQAVYAEKGRISAGILGSDSAGASGQGGVLQLQLKARKAGAVELAVSSFRPLGATAPVAVAETPRLRLEVR